MYCSKCGGYNSDHTSFCSKCGVEFNERKIKGGDILGKNYEQTITLIVQKKEEHYLIVFKEIEKGHLGGVTALGIIWPLWTLYRKMYVEFFTLMGISFVFGYVNETLGNWVSVIITIFMIICGRKLYYQSVLRKIERLGLEGMCVEDNLEMMNKVKKYGGISYTGIVIYLGFYFVIYLLLVTAAIL